MNTLLFRYELVISEKQDSGLFRVELALDLANVYNSLLYICFIFPY